MSIVFLNSFYKEQAQEVSEDKELQPVLRAQVIISEVGEMWRVVWIEPDEESKPQEDIWYEGGSMKELNDRFRLGVKAKIAVGYMPVLDGFVPREENSYYISRRVQLLYCYSEGAFDAAAHEALRLWRREQARLEGRSAFMIASNRMLQMLAAFLPRTNAELAQIPGIGDRRLLAYGAPILAITAGVERSTDFPLDWVADAVEPQRFAEWQQELEKERGVRLEERLEFKKQLLQEIGQGAGLQEIGKAVRMNRRETLIAIEELDKEGYDVSRLVELELSAIDEARQQLAHNLFAELGDRYLKPVVTRMYPEAKPGDKEIDRVYEWLRLYRLKLRRQTS